MQVRAASRSLRAVFAFFMLGIIPATSGCAAPPKIVGQAVSSASTDESAVIQKFQSARLDELSPDQIKQHVAAGLATGHPFVVMAAMSRASEWVSYGPGGSEKRAVRLAVFTQFIEQCLRSQDAFNRMSGLLFLSLLEDDKRLAAELGRDSSCLLVRPEPADPNLFDVEPGISPEETAAKVGALTSLAGIVQTRHRLIDACGRLGIEAARRNLEAIAADSQGRLVEETATTAEKALAMLDRKKSRKGSYGTEFLTEEDGRGFKRDKPEIELRGTTAKVRVQKIPPLAPSQRQLAMDLIEGEKDASPDEMVRMCEAAMASRNPYLILKAIESARNWKGVGPNLSEKRKNRPAIVEPLMERCLQSLDPFERSAGLFSLYCAGNYEELKKELDRDCSNLLIKPEAMLNPAKTDPTGEPRDLFGPEAIVSELRVNRILLISILGDLRLASARDTLEAIYLDAQDAGWQGYTTASAAREAIAKIDGLIPPKRLR